MSHLYSSRPTTRLIFLGLNEPCTRYGGTGFATGDICEFRCPQCDTSGVVLAIRTCAF